MHLVWYCIYRVSSCCLIVSQHKDQNSSVLQLILTSLIFNMQLFTAVHGEAQCETSCKCIATVDTNGQVGFWGWWLKEGWKELVRGGVSSPTVSMLIHDLCSVPEASYHGEACVHANELSQSVCKVEVWNYHLEMNHRGFSFRRIPGDCSEECYLGQTRTFPDAFVTV